MSITPPGSQRAYVPMPPADPGQGAEGRCESLRWPGLWSAAGSCLLSVPTVAATRRPAARRDPRVTFVLPAWGRRSSGRSPFGSSAGSAPPGGLEPGERRVIAVKTTTVKDVMTTSVVAVRENADFKEMVTVMRSRRVSAFPVLDAADRVVGGVA